MNTLEILREAIRRKKNISFEYSKPGKIIGQRSGNPHAIFGHPATNNLCIHIYQTGGVSDSRESLPGWRLFLMEHISGVTLREEEPCFQTAPDYNPTSAMYLNAVEKI